jgi:3-isopropylmalate/(R)-2-methylmalate dehydratase small subunit
VHRWRAPGRAWPGRSTVERDAGLASPATEVTINLKDRLITLHGADGTTAISFDVPEAQRHRLLNGLDAIAETLQHDPEIRRHEQSIPAWITPATTA